MAENEVKTDEKKEDFNSCPRCGWTTKDKPEPDKEDLKEFTRCMLAMRPFIKVYPFYEGVAKATFSTVTMEDTDNINRAILNCDKTNELDIRAFSHKVKMLYMLSSLELNRNKTDYVKPDLNSIPNDKMAETVEATFKSRFAAFPDPLQQILVRSLLLFSDLQNMLTGAALDSNFWKAAGPY